MAWITKSKHQYFYRSRRSGGKVISEYCGADILGAYAEGLDDRTRDQLYRQRQAERKEQAEQDAIDRQVDELGDQVQALVDAVLLATGHHQHKRQWRKQREYDS